MFLAKRKYRTRAVTFAYHGIAEGELRAASAIGTKADLEEHRFLRLPEVREASDIGMSFRGLPPSYIPMRNAIFYSLAAAFAEEVGAQVIVGGHNKDDLGVFRDTSTRFFRELERTFRAGSERLAGNRIRILRPLQTKTKPQVVRLASRIGVPLELTWSCHSGGTEHCWDCAGCRVRMDSFARAGIADPLRGAFQPEKVS